MNNDIAVIKNKNHTLEKFRDYSPQQLELVRKTVAKDCTTDEFNMFVEICRRQNLDPFRRQVYALVFNKDDNKKRQVAFITGIDGYRAIAKRTGTYRPSDKEPEFEIDETLKSGWNPEGIIKCTTLVYQFGADSNWYPVIGTAHWKEFAPLYEGGEWVEVKDANGKPVLQTEGQWKGRPKKEKRGNGVFKLTKDNWKTMPNVMIAKCAEAQALRKGWPEECGGFYLQEEIDQRMLDDISASEAIEMYQEDERLKAVHGKDHIPMIMAMTDGMEMIHADSLADSVLEILNNFDDPQQIENWREMNRVGLQQFWATHKNDALELKKQIEQIIKEKTNERISK